MSVVHAHAGVCDPFGDQDTSSAAIAYLELLRGEVRYCQVNANTVAALCLCGCWMQLPADCVCSSHLVARRTKKMLPCTKSQAINRQQFATNPVNLGDKTQTSGSLPMSCAPPALGPLSGGALLAQRNAEAQIMVLC